MPALSGQRLADGYHSDAYHFINSSSHIVPSSKAQYSLTLCM